MLLELFPSKLVFPPQISQGFDHSEQAVVMRGWEHGAVIAEVRLSAAPQLLPERARGSSMEGALKDGLLGLLRYFHNPELVGSMLLLYVIVSRSMAHLVFLKSVTR